jgi:hypothetical protein
MANPPKKSEQPKSKHNSGKQNTSTTPAGKYPNRVGLRNKHNNCYVPVVVQVISNVPALRALVSNVGSLPFSNATSRCGGIQIDDPDLSKRRTFLERLSNLCALLEDTTKIQLSAKPTLELMEAMRKINNNKQFKLGKEDDPSLLLSAMVDVLNDAGDKSVHLPTTNGETTLPTRVLDKAREERIKAGGHILFLEKERGSYRSAHLATGHDSSVTILMTLECVKESVCPSKTCLSPHARSFQFLNILHLSFPVSEKGYKPEVPYSVTDLLEIWARGVRRGTCEHDSKQAKETVQKLVGTPEFLVVQIDHLIMWPPMPPRIS